MEHVTDNAVVSETANQNLGGKEIRFPKGGLSEMIGSSRYGVPYTSACLNVILRSPYNSNSCGGTRPGLKPFSGTQPVDVSTYKWMWPNGDTILWPNDDKMVFEEAASSTIMPSGTVLVDQHETFTVTADKGAIPSDCTAMAFYRARMIVAKETMWYASRTGDIHDFDYGGDMDDVSRPAAGSVALAGRKGDEIKALVAISDKSLVIATGRSIWIVNGEVTNAVSLVSDSVGVISRNAWCYDGRVFWFMSYRGLYALSIGEQPVLMTPHLMDSFSGWSEATLVFDSERNGLHIIGTKNNTATDWFYDIENKAAWPVSYPSAIRPTGGGSSFVDGRNRVVFRCADNAFRYWDEGQATDDGTAIISALSLGPVVNTTGNTDNGFLAEIDCELDASVTGNNGANVSGVVGKTTNEVLAGSDTVVGWIAGGASSTCASERFRYEVSAGWNSVVRPRVRCNAFAPIIWSTQYRWAISKVTAVHRGCGRIRG